MGRTKERGSENVQRPLTSCDPNLRTLATANKIVGWLAEQFANFFIAILRDLTVSWLTRELACLYFVADNVVKLALHITILLIWY